MTETSSLARILQLFAFIAVFSRCIRLSSTTCSRFRGHTQIWSILLSMVSLLSKPAIMMRISHISCFSFTINDTTFGIIPGLLRMGTKYQMDGLRDEIINHLALSYPSTFEKYRAAVDPSVELPLFPPFPGQHYAI